MSEKLTLSLWDRAPYFFIDGDLEEPVRKTLDSELSFEVPDAQYTDAWQNNEWDGKHRLLRQSKNGNWYFPIGVIDRVKSILDALGVQYDVEGLKYPGTGDLDLPWLSGKTLREYQQDAVDEALSRGAGVIVMPTGAGKTLIGLYLMHLLDHRTVVFCHQTEIAEQWVEDIEETLGVEPARYFGGDHEQGDITVALYQSVYDPDEGDVKESVDLSHEVALFDEAHRVAADTFERVALTANATYRFGFTATPNREDNAKLRIIGGTGPIIADLSVEKLIERGYLAKPEFDMVEAPSNSSGYRDWRDEYEGEIVENNRRNKTIAKKVEGLEKPTLVTVERVNHGEYLEALMDDLGARFVHGDSPDRDEIISQFKDGDLDVLIATRGIVGEGFNVPEIASFVVAGGMKSRTSMIQQVGRALRPETETATIVDFWDRGHWVSDHSDKRIRVYQDYYGEYGP